MAINERPLGVAIIVCDMVITEQGTGNKSLISIFNTIKSLQFPFQKENLSIYVALTNGYGEQKIEIRLMKDSERMFAAEGGIKFANPNEVVELIFNLRGMVFATPGLHVFEIFADEIFVFQSKFNVLKGDISLS